MTELSRPHAERGYRPGFARSSTRTGLRRPSPELEKEHR